MLAAPLLMLARVIRALFLSSPVTFVPTYDAQQLVEVVALSQRGDGQVGPWLGVDGAPA